MTCHRQGAEGDAIHPIAYYKWFLPLKTLPGFLILAMEGEVLCACPCADLLVNLDHFIMIVW